MTEILRIAADVVTRMIVPGTPVAEIATHIDTLHKAMTATVNPPTEPVVEAPTPFVPVKKSVTPDYIICLEDGKKLKMLKRHLLTAYDMTPEEYRAKWGLPGDYPMVAPAYSHQRSALAKRIGLGSKRNG